MKKLIYSIIVVSSFVFWLFPKPISAESDFSDIYDIKISPIPYNKAQPSRSCPEEMFPIYDALKETCATSYEDFITNPIGKHYWIEDPKITAQGKADERARQFLYWVVNTRAIDEAPVIREIWNISSMIALFGVVLVTAVFGIGYIISRRTNYDFKIRIWPTIIKIGVMLLYIVFSLAIVLALVQMSEVMMKFFIDNLGGRDLFNIYFAPPESVSTLLGATERSYKEFVGARDLNIRVQEGIDTQLFLMRLTNVTYYVMGIMLLLRKILLWFLILVSPFLALLMPFILIRNTGWIWIGVFFQWLFYGPLLALFLGATSKIWREGIPFAFDFSRVSRSGSFKPEGYVYPTGLDFVYGGPGQNQTFGRFIDAANNGNYVDTFAEYVISLIMLWAVTFFPWWLLRIFRDYCCEGIYAMRNILMAMYDQMRAGPSPRGPGPVLPGAMQPLKVDIKTPIKTDVKVTLGTLQEIRNTITRDLRKTLNIEASKLTDIARMETNNVSKQSVVQNIAYLSNPAKAQIPAQKQQFMNLRSELFNRAIKNDSIAQRILASTSTSQSEKIKVREEITRTIPTMVSVGEAATQTLKISKDKIYTITNNYNQAVSSSDKTINNIAKTTNTSNENVKNILTSYTQHTGAPQNKVVQMISHETNTSENTVKQVLAQNGAIGSYVAKINQIAIKEGVPKEKITSILQTLKSETSKTEKIRDAVGGAPKAPTISLTARIQSKVEMPTEAVNNYISSIYREIAGNSTISNEISNTTNVSPPQVQNILSSYVENIDAPQSQVVESVARNNNISKEAVTNVINKANSYVTNSEVLSSSSVQSQATTLSESQMSNINTVLSEPVKIEVETGAPTISLTARIQSTTAAPSTDVETYINSVYEQVASNPTISNEIANTTNVSAPQVQNILSSYVENIDAPQSTVVENIARNNNISKEAVTNVINKANSYVTSSEITSSLESQTTSLSDSQVSNINSVLSEPVKVEVEGQETESKPIASVVSYKTELSEDDSTHIIKNVLSQAVTNEHIIQSVQERTGLQPQQVRNVINSFTQNISKPTSEIINTIHESSGISKDKVQSVLSETADTLATSQEVVESVAQKEGVETQDVARTIQTQMDLVTNPEEHITDSLVMPSTVSLEDYEQVKEMWIKHYENGEIPISDQITSRGDWVQQEVVFITNTLNKILSSDEEIRQEGLDELGFLLPIFLINNLRGDELVIYLKAKLEAAKLVVKMMAREEEIKENIGKQEEEEEVLVDLPQKEDEEKPQEMTMEEEAEGSEEVRSDEDRVEAVKEKLTQIEDESIKNEEPKTIDDLRSRLEEKSKTTE